MRAVEIVGIHPSVGTQGVGRADAEANPVLCCAFAPSDQQKRSTASVELISIDFLVLITNPPLVVGPRGFFPRRFEDLK